MRLTKKQIKWALQQIGLPAAEWMRRAAQDRPAAQEALSKHYKAAARKLHPDTPGGDEERFKVLSEVYTRLQTTLEEVETNTSASRHLDIDLHYKVSIRG